MSQLILQTDMKHFFQLQLFLITLLCTCSNLIAQSNREFRGVWIATVNNIDFPAPNLTTTEEQREDYVRYLDKIQELGFNTVIVQVRPVSDTFYPSSYEPWSKYLTGKQGKAPTPYFNPLQFMIDEAHKRNLDFHGWFNPYRVTMNADTTALAPGHPFFHHREWFVKYGNKYYFDPGHPEGRKFVLDAIMEVARHYNLDGVHFDDYFYPYKIQGQEFPDEESYQKYGGQFSEKDEWRRDNVDYFVQSLSMQLKAERPDVQFGISPFGVWRNKNVDPKGSNTRAGITNYDDLHADIVKWMKRGWIDYVIPQVYWHRELGAAPYEEVVMWWNNNCYNTNLYIGQALYKLGTKWEDPKEISEQMHINKKYDKVKGNAFFSAKYLFENPLNVTNSIKVNYKNYVLPPSVTTKELEAPSKVRITNSGGQVDKGATLKWEDTERGTGTTKYVIYRYDEGGFGHLDGKYIHDIINKAPYKEQVYVDRDLQKGKKYTYIVTALDANYNESGRSNAIMLKAGNFFSKKVKVLH